MSGITGIFRRDGRDVDPADIQKMNDKISHRGPDGSLVWCEGPVAFGHQMLHTTPESLYEILPFEDEESGLVITADARIDNRKDLAPQLGIEDNEYVSDSYFILKAYEKWGEKCPDELLGDFTFAIWDKNKESLFCSRDHMGVKPFYYYLDDDHFIFASEIKTLFSIPQIPFELNEVQLAFYLSAIYDERTLTFYKDIFRLSAAHCIIITFQKSVNEKYWELNPNLEIHFDSDMEYASEFLNIFTEAVRCRLRSAYPLGFELSGGLDSSSVVCVARKILKDSNIQINTFSKLFNNFPECDESYYIKKVVDLGGINPYYLQAGEISPLNEIDNMLWFFEEPFYFHNRHTSWVLYKKIKEKDVRILLTGNDGDTTLSHGHNYLKELAVNFHWKKLINEINMLSNNSNINISKILYKKIFLPMIPENIVKWWSIDLNKNPKILFKNKKFAKKVDIKNYLKIHRNFNFAAKTAKEYHYRTLVNGVHQSILEVLDRNTVPFSIEARHPFYDKRLIEFCYSVPTEQKTRYGWGRFLLRNSMEGLLPEEVQWRFDKVNFFPVLNKNLLFEKERLDELIQENSEILENYVDLGEVKKIYLKYKNQSRGNNPNLVFKLIKLIIWLDLTRILK